MKTELVKKKEEEELKTELVKKNRKKGRRRQNLGEERKKEKEKKRVKGQKVRLWVPPCVFNYKNVIEL